MGVLEDLGGGFQGFGWGVSGVWVGGFRVFGWGVLGCLGGGFQGFGWGVLEGQGGGRCYVFWWGFGGFCVWAEDQYIITTTFFHPIDPSLPLFPPNFSHTHQTHKATIS